MRPLFRFRRLPLGRSFLPCLSALALASLSSSAFGDPLPGLDLRSFRPSTDPRGQLVVEPVRGGDRGEMAFFAYSEAAYRPISLFSQAGNGTTRPMNVQLVGHLGASLGVGTRSQVGVVMPVAFALGGDTLPASVAASPRTPRAAVGDLGFTWKSTLRDNTAGGFGLAVLGDVTLPTGSKDAFVGEKGLTVAVRALAEYNVLVGGLQAQLGYGVRTAPVTWPANYGPTYGDWIPFRVGAWFSPKILGIDASNRQRWELGVRGYVPAGPVAPFGLGRDGAHALSSLALGASDRIALDPRGDLSVLAGAEVGIVQGAGTPAFRGILGFVYAPQETDADHDGVDDDKDQCRDVPEDRDGFEDSDGCPDIDDDDDGIPDMEDACPREPGMRNKDAALNGCGGKDSDGDGIPDRLDACPFSAGPKDGNAECNGCVDDVDTDHDGVYDEDDRCKTEPEDRDGFEDSDGCPDPDNDRDGIVDGQDACPAVAGRPSEDSKKNGCLPFDKDGDTVVDPDDRCPDAAASWSDLPAGTAATDDGCVDAPPAAKSRPRKPLATLAGADIRVSFPALTLSAAAQKDDALFAKAIDDALGKGRRHLRAVATLANGANRRLEVVVSAPKGREALVADHLKASLDDYLLQLPAVLQKTGPLGLRFRLVPAALATPTPAPKPAENAREKKQ